MESVIEHVVVKQALPMLIVTRIRNGVRGVLVGVKRGFLYAMGQLATKSFWKKLIAISVKEMMGAFLKTLGGKFVTYGLSQEDPEIKKTARSFENNTANAAFSGGYQPRSSYSGFGYGGNSQASSSFPGMT